MDLVRRELRVGTVTDDARFYRIRSVRIIRTRIEGHELAVGLDIIAVVACQASHARRLLLPRVGLGMTLRAVSDILREDDVAERILGRIGINLLRMFEVLSKVNAVDSPDDRHRAIPAPAAQRSPALVFEHVTTGNVTVIVTGCAIIGIERRRMDRA